MSVSNTKQSYYKRIEKSIISSNNSATSRQMMGKVGKNPESTTIRLWYIRNRLRKVSPRCNIRSRSESSGIVQNRPESPEVGVVRSRQSRSESSESFRVIRSCPESSGVERLWTTRNDSEQLRLRTTPNDSGRLRLRTDLVVPFYRSRNRTNNSRSFVSSSFTKRHL